MKRPFLALLILCSLSALAHGQSLARRDHADVQIIEDATADQVVAARAILLLKRLDDDVIVYRSIGQFEESGKLARVSFEAFQIDLSEVSAEVRANASRLPAGRLKTDIFNALASYHDGAFYWRQVYRPRVVSVSSLTDNRDSSPSESFFQSYTPYTVAIYWRQANRCLQRAIQQAASLSQS
ncbi:MAG TPA: hypothetical protein VGQ72_11710 [Pyrinomonadaceae bacterium]|jgi:hypothetical protein|nr:hypothetical protein [Pyrinomonadaceae bacterium]